jgi:Glycosyl transferase family 90
MNLILDLGVFDACGTWSAVTSNDSGGAWTPIAFNVIHCRRCRVGDYWSRCQIVGLDLRAPGKATMMLHALSETTEKRRRSRAACLSLIVVLLVVAVMNELYKAFQTTEYFHEKDRPRFSAMTDFELRIHLEAGLPVYKHHSNGVAKPRRPFDADTTTSPQRSFRLPNGQITDMVATEPDIEAADNASEGDGEDDRVLSKAEKERRNLDFAYQTRDEMLARSERFPSVQERVKLYMSNWYTRPCDQSAAVLYDYTPYNTTLSFVTLREIVLTREQEETRLFQINSLFHGSSMSGSFDQVHFMDREAMMECAHRYCKDVVEFLLPALDRVVVEGTITTIPPILYQFGDDNRTKAMRAPVPSSYSSSPLPASSLDSPANKSPRKTDRYPNMPVFKKIRKSIRRTELKRLTDSHICYKRDKRIIPEDYHLEPIVFKLKTQRHFGRIYDIAELDIPWHAKKNVAIFRGELNGNYPVDYVASGSIQQHTVHQRCRLLDRCWLVYQHAARRSPLVDAKITLPYIRNNSKQIPRYLNQNPDAASVENDDTEPEEDNEGDNEIADDEVDLYGEKVSLEEMLQYKALIMLEGNDVSSGLKWALFSNSVVLMPEPTLISWAMEERLEPWVHYIPINVYKDGFGSKKSSAALTDVEEKMQWVLDHDDQAQQIARAGKLWIADLVLHPDVATDEVAIFDEMIRRYAAHFVRDGS